MGEIARETAVPDCYDISCPSLAIDFKKLLHNMTFAFYIPFL